MSVRIGEVREAGHTEPFAHVYASLGGVELTCERRGSLTPVEARNYASLLVRAADECERMRDRSAREASENRA